MTDNELKFFDPETGKPLHRVPEGATIPKGTPYGHFGRGERWWHARGAGFDLHPKDSIPRFTREPIAPPLPTEPGYYIGKDGRPWGLNGGRWYLFGVEHVFKASEVECFAPFTPVTLVPTETWDRLRVLDPEDTRDRIGAGDTQWRWAEGAWRHVCDNDCRTAYSSLEGLSDWYGPLRFADEVSDDA